MLCCSMMEGKKTPGGRRTPRTPDLFLPAARQAVAEEAEAFQPSAAARAPSPGMAINSRAGGTWQGRFDSEPLWGTYS